MLRIQLNLSDSLGERLREQAHALDVPLGNLIVALIDQGEEQLRAGNWTAEIRPRSTEQARRATR